jgi:hypothetical protein
MPITKATSNVIAPITATGSTTARSLPDRLADVVNVKDFGAHSTTESGYETFDSTASINACFAQAIATGKSAFIPAGRYRFNGYTNTSTSAINFSVEGEEGNWPTLVMDARPTSPTTYGFLLNSTRYSTVSGLTLATNIKPNQQTITLTSANGLAVGMIIQISSDRLWYNGNRGVYYCGEIHKITRVSGNTITLEDFTRDVYTTSEVLTIRAWNPSKVTIRNLNLESPSPATGVGIAIQQCDGALIENVKLNTFNSTFILNALSWKTTFRNISVVGDPSLTGAQSIGYGIEDNGSVGTFVDGLYSKGIRRAYDGGSISGTTLAAVCRDARVTNFIVDGGGPYFPVTNIISYGIGSHGSCEGLIVSDGIIRDCYNGITARGRNTTVSNVVFQGTLDTCVAIYEDGEGLIVENCKYENFNYPSKFANLNDIQDGSGANIFVQLGLSDSWCLFDIPIVIKGNIVKGIKESFVSSKMPKIRDGVDIVVKNLQVHDNTIESIAGDGNTLDVIDSTVNFMPFRSSVLSNNKISAINGSWNLISSNIEIGYSPNNLVRDRSFIINGVYYVLIATDTVVVIRNFFIDGRRAYMAAQAGADGQTFVRITPNNATLQAIGSSNTATFVGNASGATMTGTTGVVGNVSFGLEANGDLYIENRQATAIELAINPVA